MEGNSNEKSNETIQTALLTELDFGAIGTNCISFTESDHYDQ